MRHRSVAVMCVFAFITQACLLFEPVNTQERADAGQVEDTGSTTAEDTGTSRDMSDAPSPSDMGEVDMGSCPPSPEECNGTSAAEPIVCAPRGVDFAPTRCYEDESGCVVSQELDCPFGSTCQEDERGGILSDVCLPCADSEDLEQECVGKGEVCLDGKHYLCEERSLGCIIKVEASCQPDTYCDDSTGACLACDPNDPNPPVECDPCESNVCDGIPENTPVNCIPNVPTRIARCLPDDRGCLSLIVADCPSGSVCEDSAMIQCVACSELPDSCRPVSDPFDPGNYRCNGDRLQRCQRDPNTPCHRWIDEEDCASKGRYGGVCGDAGAVNPSTMSVLIRATCWENECDVGVSPNTCSMNAQQVLSCIADRDSRLEYYGAILSCLTGLSCQNGECLP